MNRLTIISDTYDHGQAFGLSIGLSSPQFRVVTNIEDTNTVPNEGFIIHDNYHPLNSLELQDLLIRCGAKSLRDKDYLDKMMTAMHQIFTMEYDLRKHSNSDHTTQHGVNNILSKLRELQFTKENKIEFIIARHPQQLYFYISGKTALAEVIVNLYKGWLSRYYSNQQLTQAIEIYDPKGIFKQKSINYGW